MASRYKGMYVREIVDGHIFDFEIYDEPRLLSDRTMILKARYKSGRIRDFKVNDPSIEIISKEETRAMTARYNRMHSKLTPGVFGIIEDWYTLYQDGIGTMLKGNIYHDTARGYPNGFKLTLYKADFSVRGYVKSEGYRYQLGQALRK